jgi:hypothetical protein
MSVYMPCGQTKAKEAMAFWRVALPNSIDRLGYGQRHGLAGIQMLQNSQDPSLNKTLHCCRHPLTSYGHQTPPVSPPD